MIKNMPANRAREGGFMFFVEFFLIFYNGILTFVSKSVKYLIISNSSERRDSNEGIDLFHFIVSRHEFNAGMGAGAGYG